MINATDQSRIEQVTLEYNPTTQNHYLLTSFTAGYQSGAEVLWYIDQLETGTWAGQFTGTGNTSWVPTYTTITSDQNFDIYATATSFTSTGTPFSIQFGWYEFPQMLALPEANFANSAAVYTGQNTCPTATPTGSISPTPTPSATPTPGPVLQRWGDYNSLIWDPSLITCASGERTSVWSAVEFTQGATDQSTLWTQFYDALPCFVNSNGAESECTQGAGHDCEVTVGVPYGVQPGDVLLAALDMGEASTTLPSLPSGWTPLSASNLTGSPQQISATVSGGTLSSWLAAHVYGNNEPISYKFVHNNNNGTELSAMIVAYRGGNENLSNYTGYGFVQNGLNSSFTIGAISPLGETELVDLIDADGGCDTPEKYEAVSESLTAPSGSPTLAPETPLTQLWYGWLAADAGVPTAGQSYGTYTLTESPANGCQNTKGAIWLAWGVAIPVQ